MPATPSEAQLDTNLSSVVGAQVRHLVNNLTKKNFKSTAQELASLKQRCGAEVTMNILCCLVEAVDFNEAKPLVKDGARLMLLSQEFTELSKYSNFTTYILRAFANAADINTKFIEHVCEILHLPLAQQIAVGFAFTQSADALVRQIGTQFLKNKLDEVDANFDSSSVPEHLLHSLLFLMRTQEGFQSQLNNILNAFSLQKHQINAQTPLSLCSLLSDTNGIDSKWHFDAEVKDGARIASALSDKLRQSVCPVELMEDIGYSCCASVPKFENFLRQFLPLNEEIIAKMIGLICRTHTGLSGDLTMQEYSALELWGDSDKQQGVATTWNVGVFIEVISNLKLNIQWPKVIRALDHPRFYLVDLKGLMMLVDIYTALSRENKFPTNELLAEWKEKDGQLSVMQLISQSSNFPFHNVKEIDLYASYPAASHPIVALHPCWRYVDFVERLIHLAEGHRYVIVSNMLEMPVKNSPEVIAIGLSQVKMNQPNILYHELSSVLMSMFLSNHINSGFVLPRVWAANHKMVLQGMLELYNLDKANISRILDFAQDLKALERVLWESKSFYFMIDLAILASRREFLNLNKWLSEHVKKFKEPFARACIEYYKDRQNQLGDASKQTLETTFDSIIECLDEQSDQLNPEIAAEIKQLAKEKQASKIFTLIYKYPINEAIELFKNLKNSSNKDDHDVFQFIVETLLNEFPYFDNFKEGFLRITGALYGALIDNQLLQGEFLEKASNNIIQALSNPNNHKVFKLFGVTALNQFKSKLYQWPAFCQMLSQIPHLSAELAKFIKLDPHAQPNNPNPLVNSGSNVLTNSNNRVNNSINPVNNNAMNNNNNNNNNNNPSLTAQDREIMRSSVPIDVLLDSLIRGVRAPDEALHDKVFFIFNNVSPQNVEQKSAELKQLLPPEFYAWLGQYIVVKRVSIEPNFHAVYLKFLDTLAIPSLDQFTLDATYKNINILLQSEKIISNAEMQRTVLNNLGSWLGNITIAKNKPILFKFLDLKSLLIDGYKKGSLLAMVSFVCRVLEACNHSKLIRVTNAWAAQLLRFLKEIYLIPNLKIQIKFEVEILCGKLSLDLDSLEPTTYLPNMEQCPRPNPDLNSSSNNAPLNTSTQALNTSTNNALGMAPGVPAGIGQPVPTTTNTTSSMPAPMRQLVNNIIEKAVRDIIQPVVERSVTIACITTQALITKDFCTEPNEQKIRHAAHLTVKNLAGNLALVTCRDPLRANIINSLTSYFSNQIVDPIILEQTVQKICSENLDAACQLIEQNAVDKALIEIDENMNSILAHRTAAQPNFYRFLPKALITDANGLYPYQWNVYEDFGRTRSYPSSSSGSVIAPPPTGGPSQLPHTVNPNYATATGGVTPAGAATLMRPSNVSGNVNVPPNQWNNPTHIDQYGKQIVGTTTRPQDALTSSAGLVPNTPGNMGAGSWQNAVDDINERFKEIIKRLDSKLQQPNVQNSEIYSMFNQISILQDRSPSADETCFGFAKHLFGMLFQSTTTSQLDVYSLLLKNYRTPQVVAEFTSNYEFLNPERKFNRDVVYRLINNRLIQLPEFDSHISQLLASGNEQAIEFIRSVIKYCVHEVKSITNTDLPRSIEMLERIQNKLRASQTTTPSNTSGSNLSTANNNNNNNYSASLRDLHAQQQAAAAASSSTATATPQAEEMYDYMLEYSPEIKERVLKLFDEWTIMINQPEVNLVNTNKFVSKLLQDILSTPEASKFFSVCTRVCVAHYLASHKNTTLDSFAKLVTMMVKLAPDDSKIGLLNMALGVTCLILIEDYEANPGEFNQQPYYHLFAYWLNELLGGREKKEMLHWMILVAFTNVFSYLQPSKVVSFTFAWLELISHRHFMPKLLLHPSRKGLGKFQGLLVELFQFLEPLLRNAELNATILALYRGTLRVLLVLLHDFPEFLCDYHFAFCDVIPPSCIQMRNLILSAFPRNMKLPDPFTPNLKVDLLPDIGNPPNILSNYAAALQRNKFIQEVDHYLKNRSPSTFLSDLRSRLLLPPQDAYAIGVQYNVPLINSLVLYVGAFDLMHQSSPFSANSAARDIFLYLVFNLNAEGRYFVLNAMANQLRYPNKHTYYFSFTILNLFLEEPHSDIVKEQITRVLLERLTVNRPHPWGLLITFIELIKNKLYKFWELPFIGCAPEIEKLFQSVASSINMPKTTEETQ